MYIRQANSQDVDQLAELFAQYRVFYGQKYEPDASALFVNARMLHKDSVLFVAEKDERLVGFTQLYPSFTSVGMAAVWILNDLFVHADYRKQGVAEALIKQVFLYAQETDRARVFLSTDISNSSAQALYDKLGFERQSSYNYEKNID